MNKEKSSKISTRKRKLAYGIGVNDANYLVKPTVNGKCIVCQFYRIWQHMLYRCYSAKYHHKFPTYIDCTVCDEWLTFSNFRSWMITQDWKGKELDKDILVQGNKVYSPETCMFVSQAINSLITDRKASRGIYPQGVCFDKQIGKYKAQVNINGSRKNLGRYSTTEQAFKAYKYAKYAIIRSIELKQSEPLKSALLNYKIGEQN